MAKLSELVARVVADSGPPSGEGEQRVQQAEETVMALQKKAGIGLGHSHKDGF